ncbi:hypothetical protein SAMN06297251_10298 [Fulvimarina manganoxydans]|uniref:Uncharacterized protein n=1 Tax=Fulvimarina manganoxydans TaxID=937218 RepID=A0A1W1YYN0_9HYPH|nr:hypothetical protein [Fulvimarina manganoxydans]SMC41327.1 hypothetical protein SAMN06297251_10298 [Fulvimarina manganoxydans]
MSDDTRIIAARFTLFVRCANCLRDTKRCLEVPQADDAPSDIDELLDSAYLAGQRFACTQCDSSIATIVGIKQNAA